jgi:cyclase
MLRPRLIPCLLIHKGGLVETVRFGDPKYVGDPLNAVRIFNEKQVDELMVLDIDATANGKAPDLALIERLASECRMPLCYGGGVKTPQEIEQIVSLGVEKVAIASSLVDNPALLPSAAERVGRQSLVAVLDVRRTGTATYQVFTRNGRTDTGLDAVPFAARCASDGAGEIVLNVIDRDGTMEGYDCELAELVRSRVDVPLTVLGGAGSLEHVAELYQRLGIVGAAAGSLFVFKGPRRAVLINYPRADAKAQLLSGLAAV